MKEQGPLAEHFQRIVSDDVIHILAQDSLGNGVSIHDDIVRIHHKDHLWDMFQYVVARNGNKIKDAKPEHANGDQRGSDRKRDRRKINMQG